MLNRTFTEASFLFFTVTEPDNRQPDFKTDEVKDVSVFHALLRVYLFTAA